MTLFEHLFGAALPDFIQVLCTACLLHLWVMQICQDQSETNPFQSMDFFYFFSPNGTDCYFWLSDPSWVFSLSWGTASPITLVGMDVLVSPSSVYSCLQRRALGVAMLAPPPVTPHLPLTHSWVIFFNVGSTSKNDHGVGKFPYWDIRWSKSHLPNT